MMRGTINMGHNYNITYYKDWEEKEDLTRKPKEPGKVKSLSFR